MRAGKTSPGNASTVTSTRRPTARNGTSAARAGARTLSREVSTRSNSGVPGTTKSPTSTRRAAIRPGHGARTEDLSSWSFTVASRASATSRLVTASSSCAWVTA